MLFSWNTIILYLYTTFWREGQSSDYRTEDLKDGEKQVSAVKPGRVNVVVHLV